MEPRLRRRLRTEGMDEWFAGATLAARIRLAVRLTDTATALLDLRPARSLPALAAPPAETWEVQLDHLAAWVRDRLADPAYPYGEEPTQALIRSLADRREPDALVPSLLHDLAEILTLPRRERAEYRHHVLPSPPWRIRKLLLEYAVKAMALDRLVTALNKAFCAERCPDPPVGCCHILGYDLGLVPEAMLALQGLEAAWQASAGTRWAPLAAGVVERKCRYHTERGCVLVRWKSPACIGTLCAALLAHLPTQHPSALLDPLLTALARFRNADLDRERIFDAMEALLMAGAPLVSPGAPPGPGPASDLGV